MSLLRLLRTGKSLVGLDDGERRFQPAAGSLLPKFGSKKNPFRTTAKSESARNQAEPKAVVAEPALLDQAAQPESGCGQKMSAELWCPSSGAVIAAETPALSARDEIAATEAVAAPRQELPAVAESKGVRPAAMVACRMARLKDWVGKRAAKVGSWFARAPKPGKASAPQFVRPATQTELSLDRVKVMRNDLSDADLELVPAKASSKPSVTASKKKSLRQPSANAERHSQPASASAEQAGAGRS